MDLSLIIPVKNEAGNIEPLVCEIRSALDDFLTYEILFVDDGSNDGTVAEIGLVAAELPNVRLLCHARSFGQSAAIRTGVKAARADWIATLDGDGQNDPADLPRLWRVGMASDGAPVLVNGYRRNRHDSFSKRWASRIANAVRSRCLGDSTPDAGCGLKLFPRALFLDLPYFDHMHRFLPALVLREGGKVHSMVVNHRPRRGGVSKYGVCDRLGVGIVDLVGVMWLTRRAKHPQLLDGAAIVTTPASAPRVVSLSR
jgi:dolichol-phosphate mannosyltransferase